MTAKRKTRVKVVKVVESTIPAIPQQSWSERAEYCLKFLYYQDVLTESQYRRSMRRAAMVNSVTIQIPTINPTTKARARCRKS